MALQPLAAIYKRFLASPSSSLLTEKATLHYVTTTSTFSGSTDIIKHVSNTKSQLSKKEAFLTVIEASCALAVEVETTIVFYIGGGAYLPAMDENFLSDRTVDLIVTHMVLFDGSGQIAQIRLSWDQGGLLKQLDIIGSTGRNWPIRESKEQLAMLTSCLRSTSQTPTTTDEISSRSRGSSNAMRDPYASLTLFGPREEIEKAPDAMVSPYGGTRPAQRSFTEILGDEDDAPTPSKTAVISPYAGRRPPQRSVTDILRDDGPEDDPVTPTGKRELPRSPTKAIASKTGAGKNFQPSRLFDNDENARPRTSDQTVSRGKSYTLHTRQHQHFDFTDGLDPQDAPKPGLPSDKRPQNKHDSNWSFDDFLAPQTPVPSTVPIKTHRHQDVHHWNTEGTATETPVRQQAPVKPRRDAETHFELQDDGLPAEGSRIANRPRGSLHNTGLHLYDSSKVYQEDNTAPSPGPLGNITNLKDRRKDFDAHFTMADSSPAQQAPQAPHKISEDRKKAVKMMEPNWATLDKSPVSQKENKPYKYNDPNKQGDGRGIAIGGDGMGGKKGSDHDWIYGDDQMAPKAVPGKNPGMNPSTTKDGRFWDF